MAIVFLADLDTDQTGTVLSVGGSGRTRHRLLEMGITEGADVQVIRCAPLGDPIEVCIRGYCLSLRKDEAQDILLATPPSMPLTSTKIGHEYIITHILGGSCVHLAIDEKGISPGLIVWRIDQNTPGVQLYWNGGMNRVGYGMARKIIVQENGRRDEK